jgi:hypothetical protein
VVGLAINFEHGVDGFAFRADGVRHVGGDPWCGGVRIMENKFHSLKNEGYSNELFDPPF